MSSPHAERPVNRAAATTKALDPPRSLKPNIVLSFRIVTLPTATREADRFVLRLPATPDI